jgi:hypothetical protein
MDLSKVPLLKHFGVIAGIIPGSTALFVYYLANPDPFHHLFAPNSIGYSTKVTLLLGIAFVVGNSLSTLASAFAGAIGGVFGYLKSLKDPSWPSVRKTAPWRDPHWRKLAIQYLGDNAPNDTRPMSDENFQAQRNALMYLPVSEQDHAVSCLVTSRMSLATDDSDWMRWYLQFDRQRKARESPDETEYVHGGLKFNLQVTALYLAAGMILVPATRRWFCVLFCAVWGIILFAEVFVALKRGPDPWSTWSDQLDFLARELRESVKGGNVEDSR